MADRVYTSMHRVETARAATLEDRVATQSSEAQLYARDRAVLTRSNARDRLVRGSFVVHMTTKVPGPPDSPPRPGERSCRRSSLRGILGGR